MLYRQWLGGLRENNVKTWADLPAEKKVAIEATS
jgi:hypothetical protein